MTQLEVPIASFQETFCAQYGVPTANYATTVLRLTLYPHARWLADIGSKGSFAADRSFVAGVGLLTRWRDFEAEVHEFQQAPDNRRFWRRRMRLRVSVGRMKVLFSDVMGGTGSPRRAAAPSAETSSDAGEPVTG